MDIKIVNYNKKKAKKKRIPLSLPIFKRYRSLKRLVNKRSCRIPKRNQKKSICENVIDSTTDYEHVEDDYEQQRQDHSPTVDEDVNLNESIDEDVNLNESVDEDVNLNESVDEDVNLNESVDEDVNLNESVVEDVNVETNAEIWCFPTKSSSCSLYVMSPRNSIAFWGRIGIRVLRGCVKVFGYTIQKHDDLVRMFSTSSSSALVIEADFLGQVENDPLPLDDLLLDVQMKNEIETSIKVDSAVFVVEPFNDTLSRSLKDYYPYLYTPKCGRNLNAESNTEDCTFFDPGRSCLYVPSAWLEVEHSLKQDYFAEDSEGSMIVLICGGQNVGKSTLMRYFINSFLSHLDEVFLLDCDPGQAECTPSGCVSLLKITQPLLGPSFTHLQMPVKSCYIGCAHPAQDPGHYVACVRELCESYKDLTASSKRSLLFVNTMGWVKGLGLKLLMDTVLMIRPTHIVQLNRPIKSRVWNVNSMTDEYIESESGWSISSETSPPLGHKLIELGCVQSAKRTSNSAELRELSYVAYFSQLWKPHLDMPFFINFCSPYRVPWSSVAIWTMFSSLRFKEELYALNGALVMLGNCDSSLFQESCDPTLPKFLTRLPICDAMGYGIVRGISMAEKAFYVITPVPTTSLSKVNVLLRGIVSVSEKLMQKQMVDGWIPYLENTRLVETMLSGKAIRGRLFKKPCSMSKKLQKRAKKRFS